VTQFRSVSRIYHSKRARKAAKLYSSADALAEIYKSDSLEAARVKQALSQAALNEVREQELRKQRIPVQDALDIMDEVFQAMSAILKAAEGKQLTRESNQRSIREVSLCAGDVALVIRRNHRKTVVDVQNFRIKAWV
jgi:hypothetical protein